MVMSRVFESWVCCSRRAIERQHRDALTAWSGGRIASQQPAVQQRRVMHSVCERAHEIWAERCQCQHLWARRRRCRPVDKLWTEIFDCRFKSHLCCVYWTLSDGLCKLSWRQQLARSSIPQWGAIRESRDLLHHTTAVTTELIALA